MINIFSIFAQSDGKINIGSGKDSLSVKIPKTAADSATLGEILNVVYFWAGIVAVLVLIVAGLYYVLSSGDMNKTARAKNAIIGAVAGLVIVLMAYVITGVVLRVA